MIGVKHVLIAIAIAVGMIWGFISLMDSNNGDSPYLDIMPTGNRLISTIEFEECEYVYIRRYGSIALTHKGNCKNH